MSVNTCTWKNSVISEALNDRGLTNYGRKNAQTEIYANTGIKVHPLSY